MLQVFGIWRQEQQYYRHENQKRVSYVGQSVQSSHERCAST